MESMSEAAKKDIPLRKMLCRDCVLSGREQEGRNINLEEGKLDFIWTGYVTVQS